MKGLTLRFVLKAGARDATGPSFKHLASGDYLGMGFVVPGGVRS